ncbi:bifunctional TH2 protein, mitochondrial-like [Pyrus x bretschneideri]|uniref:bifunctional TH2 protein, mitochondrial-like n=1 Tax=Pyrus x bretschneideri TaxID=225117 RepID=UPI002030860E|nr:bifunctional TH2 protein, mitochondrial-like [Pyrus x bretschneideri]
MFNLINQIPLIFLLLGDDDDAKPVISELRTAVQQELTMHDSFVMEWGLQGAKEAPINSAAVKYTDFLLTTTSVKVEGVKGPGKITTPFERTKVALSQMLGFCKMYQCNLGQKNDQESAAATEALVNGKTTPKMMLHGNYTMN